MKTLKLLLIAFVAALMIVACDKKDDSNDPIEPPPPPPPGKAVIIIRFDSPGSPAVRVVEPWARLVDSVGLRMIALPFKMGGAYYWEGNSDIDETQPQIMEVTDSLIGRNVTVEFRCNLMVNDNPSIGGGYPNDGTLAKFPIHPLRDTNNILIHIPFRDC